jgi:hypothetical protein
VLVNDAEGILNATNAGEEAGWAIRYARHSHLVENERICENVIEYVKEGIK